MNILWLVSDHAGCGTYRAYFPALYLETKGIVSHFLRHDVAAKSDPEKELEGMKCLILQRALDYYVPTWIRLARAKGIPIIFEMDDYLFRVPPHNPAHWFYRLNETQRILHHCLDEADQLIFSTEPLISAATTEVGRTILNKSHLCVNHLHPLYWGSEAFTQVTVATSDKLVLGWHGSSTHNQDFKEVVSVLKRILEEYDVILRVFGKLPTSIRGAIPANKIQQHRWVPYDMFPGTLKGLGFDIAIAPLEDTRFNRCKSNLKWLEYSALGVPCVASKVYPYAESIEHGITGFLASSADGWYKSLKALILSKDLRHTVGEAAKEHVWKLYGPERAEEWEKVINAACISSGSHLQSSPALT